MCPRRFRGFRPQLGTRILSDNYTPDGWKNSQSGMHVVYGMESFPSSIDTFDQFKSLNNPVKYWNIEEKNKP